MNSFFSKFCDEEPNLFNTNNKENILIVEQPKKLTTIEKLEKNNLNKKNILCEKYNIDYNKCYEDKKDFKKCINIFNKMITCDIIINK